MLSVIPYTTFPEITIGPLTLRTFGLMVGLGVLLGAWIAARYAEANAGLPREDTYRMATILVIAGIVGARLTWVLSHTEEIDSPIDVIAVWEGGLQFSGGFAAAILFGIPFFRRWDRRTRWIALDGYAYGLSIGLAIGRIGCYSVGEHFGSLSDFLLAVRYDGGDVREPLLGDVPLQVGMTFHQTAMYEGLYLAALFGVLAVLVRRGYRPATLIAIFCAWYGVSRFLSDFLRVNDETLLGLTGAQYLMGAMALASIWIWFWVRPNVPPTAEATELVDPPGESAEVEVDEDEVEADAEENAEP